MRVNRLEVVENFGKGVGRLSAAFQEESFFGWQMRLLGRRSEKDLALSLELLYGIMHDCQSQSHADFGIMPAGRQDKRRVK